MLLLKLMLVIFSDTINYYAKHTEFVIIVYSLIFINLQYKAIYCRTSIDITLSQQAIRVHSRSLPGVNKNMRIWFP